MPLDVNGFDELMTDIAGMANKMDADGAGAPVAKRILEAAAVPIHEQMQANASHDPQILSANLHAALQIGRVKRSSKRGRHITIGVHRNQQAYYQRYVRNHPEYQLVDIFADEGITGLNTRKRDQFKRMIEECEAGHVDMIITKSISRMFRNTADCLLYTRELKKRGIGVLFEEQNINTLDSTGELMLTILSSLAQDESRNISENTTWGIRSRFQQGHLHLNTNRFLGYDKDKDGNLIINPDQAKLVRRIYDSFLDGISPDTIASQFRNEKIPTIMGTSNWQASTIYGILRNEKYKGDAGY